VTQAAMATTPSQPISGTGLGEAGMLTTFCRSSKIALKASPMVPSTPLKNQLVGPCSCTQSRISLSQVWKPVVSWKPSSRVCSPRRMNHNTTQTPTTPSSFNAVWRFLPYSTAGCSSLEG
jgi:hypothetical protein